MDRSNFNKISHFFKYVCLICFYLKIIILCLFQKNKSYLFTKNLFVLKKFKFKQTSPIINAPPQ